MVAKAQIQSNSLFSLSLIDSLRVNFFMGATTSAIASDIHLEPEAVEELYRKSLPVGGEERLVEMLSGYKVHDAIFIPFAIGYYNYGCTRNNRGTVNAFIRNYETTYVGDDAIGHYRYVYRKMIDEYNALTIAKQPQPIEGFTEQVRTFWDV